MTIHEVLEKEQRNNVKLLPQFRLMDDDFMTAVFDGNIEATQYLLNTILNRQDIEVMEVTAQKGYKSPYAKGRSIRLDIYARDKSGKVYDIEIQRSDRGAAAKRARFNSSMMDSRLLKSGESFEKLADTYVIFITENDVLGEGRAIYHINRRVSESNVDFGDGSNIIYVNGSYRNDTDSIGQLMHDFRCVDAEDMFSPVLAKNVKYFKDHKGGKNNMCKLIEDRMKEVEAALRPAMEEELTPILEAKIEARVEAKMRHTLEAKIRPALEADIRTALEAEIRPALEADIRSALEADIRTALEAEITLRVTEKIRNELEEKLRKEIRDELTGKAYKIS